MNDQDFHQEQLQLLRDFNERLQKLTQAPSGGMLGELAAQFDDLVTAPHTFLDEGPAVVARMMTTTPQLAEHFPRELLWYLGGECLHFMPDEEIDQLTALDEERRAAAARGETFAWRSAHDATRNLP